VADLGGDRVSTV